jgi:hypothetical protein
MSEPSDLSLEPQSRFTFLLCELQLASLIVSDTSHAYPTTEIPKDLVLSRVHNRREALHLLAKLIERVSSLSRKLRDTAGGDSAKKKHLVIFWGILLQ